MAMFVALFEWVALVKCWRQVQYVAKPGVIVLLAIWFWQTTQWRGFALWIAIGLIFSLAGDILLMLPRARFVAGLGSFLAAHLAYGIGFNTPLPGWNLAGVILVLLLVLSVYPVIRRVDNSIRSGADRSLRLPVIIYSLAILWMASSALLTLTRSDWNAAPALCASSGALLFLLSDIILAWNKFVAPLENAELRLMVTYHLGQAFLVLGAAYHLLNL